MDGIELESVDGAGTEHDLDEIQAVYAAAFPDHDLGDHRWRTLRQIKSAGFQAILARADGELVGFVYGLPLSPASKWWEGLEPPASASFTRETGQRTFAVIDLAVLPSHGGRGLGRLLMDDLLESRKEERATLATNPDERNVRRMYERWGWREVGHVPGAKGETQSSFALYVRALCEEPDPSRSR